MIDGNYWAHIIVNRQYVDNDFDGMHKAYGEIVSGRIDSDSGVMPIPNHPAITQIALLIKPTRTPA